MISPESHGQTKGRQIGNGSLEVRVTAYQRDRAEFKNNTTKKPLGHEEITYTASAHGELTIFKRFDVYLNPNFLLNAPNIGGVKYQLIGKNRNEAQKGNFSLALTAGLGRARGGAKDSHAIFEFGSNTSLTDNVKEVEYNVHHREAGLIMGYRWNDKLVHYAGANLFTQTITGKVTTKDKVIMDKSFTFDQRGLLYTMGLLQYFGKSAFFKFELAHMRSTYSFSFYHSANSANAGIGFFW